MGDTLVLHGLIATPSFHKHTNTWHGGVVFQRSYHQAVWELGHLKEERKNVTQNTQLSHRNKTNGTLQLKMTPAIRKILQKLTKHTRSVFSEENIMTTGCELISIVFCSIREQHLPGHPGEEEVRLWTVSDLRGVQPDYRSSWQLHSNVSAGRWHRN